MFSRLSFSHYLFTNLARQLIDDGMKSLSIEMKKNLHHMTKYLSIKTTTHSCNE